MQTELAISIEESTKVCLISKVIADALNRNHPLPFVAHDECLVFQDFCIYLNKIHRLQASQQGIICSNGFSHGRYHLQLRIESRKE